MLRALGFVSEPPNHILKKTIGTLAQQYNHAEMDDKKLEETVYQLCRSAFEVYADIDLPDDNMRTPLIQVALLAIKPDEQEKNYSRLAYFIMKWLFEKRQHESTDLNVNQQDIVRKDNNIIKKNTALMYLVQYEDDNGEVKEDHPNTYRRKMIDLLLAQRPNLDLGNQEERLTVYGYAIGCGNMYFLTRQQALEDCFTNCPLPQAVSRTRLAVKIDQHGFIIKHWLDFAEKKFQKGNDVSILKSHLIRADLLAVALEHNLSALKSLMEKSELVLSHELWKRHSPTIDKLCSEKQLDPELARAVEEKMQGEYEKIFKAYTHIIQRAGVAEEYTGRLMPNTPADGTEFVIVDEPEVVEVTLPAATPTPSISLLTSSFFNSSILTELPVIKNTENTIQLRQS